MNLNIYQNCVDISIQKQRDRIYSLLKLLNLKMVKFTNSTNEMQLNFNSLLSLIIRFADFHNMQIAG